MSNLTLVEIIAEGKRLRAEYELAVDEGFDSTANALWNDNCEFWFEHGPTLLANAKTLTCSCGKPRRIGPCPGSRDNDE